MVNKDAKHSMISIVLLELFLHKNKMFFHIKYLLAMFLKKETKPIQDGC
tara:strand:- start:222 stop:368 length:147 start_codon:yes stop_codon:yes gene_type:complete